VSLSERCFSFHFFSLLFHRPFFEFFDIALRVIETFQKIMMSTVGIDSLLEGIGRLRFTPKSLSSAPHRVDISFLLNAIPSSSSSSNTSTSCALGAGFSEFGDVPLEELFNALKMKNIIQVLLSIAAERRIIFIADNLRRLSMSVLALASFLYPFSWQYIFIPILPQQCLSYCCAPMPFLVGVHSSHLEELNSMPLEEVVLVDLDNDSVIGCATEDLEAMPTAACATLTKAVKSKCSRESIIFFFPSSSSSSSSSPNTATILSFRIPQK
jgi:hypothetical protein